MTIGIIFLILLACAPASQAPAEEKTLKIGCIMPFTGPAGLWGTSIKPGMDLYAQFINEDGGLKVGNDIFLAFSPEREDPGNEKFSTRTIPKVCGGVTPDCLEVGLALYGAVIDRVVSVSSTRAAEMTKLLENIHRAVNIAGVAIAAFLSEFNFSAKSCTISFLTFFVSDVFFSGTFLIKSS